MDTFGLNTRHLMRQLLEPLTGCLTAVITMSWFQNFAFSMVTAFFGGIVAYFAKKLCDYMVAYFKKRKVRLRR